MRGSVYITMRRVRFAVLMAAVLAGVPRAHGQATGAIAGTVFDSLRTYAPLRDATVMAAALRHLPAQRRPSEVVVPGLLDGLDNVDRLARRWLDRPIVERRVASTRRLTVVSGNRASGGR